MDWVMSPSFLAEVLLVIALVVCIPSGTATLIAVHDRRVGGTVRPAVRGFQILSYALSALVLLTLAIFLLTNHVRIENMVFV